MLGALGRRYGNFDAAEDAVQEALIAAAERWPQDGIPQEPRAWLATTATRRLVDRARSERSRRDREQRVAAREVPVPGAPEADDSLTVLFLCCHPALSPASAVALTLRAVGGLTTAEVARAFIVPEATMAQRISRARRTVKDSGEPFRMPSGHDYAARLRSVLRVLYLIFNEGYVSSAGEQLGRVDLSHEAIRLTRLLVEAAPNEPEALGLLALMLLIEARRPARTDPAGDLVALPDQDRSRWDDAMVDEGVALLERAVEMGAVGEYQLQAAIAAVHDRAPSAGATDWPQVLALYGLLERVAGGPVVTLNRAVAAAMVDGPRAGLAVLDGVSDRMGGTQRWLAVRGQLSAMAGDTQVAAELLERAGALATSVPERRYLAREVARLRAHASQVE